MPTVEVQNPSISAASAPRVSHRIAVLRGPSQLVEFVPRDAEKHYVENKRDQCDERSQ